MASSIKKSGQKVFRKFSRASSRVKKEGKEHIRENLIRRLSHIENIKLLIFEWGLLVFALIMLAITQAFWFGDSYAEKVYTFGGTYIEATIGDVNSMNPLFAVTDSEKTLSRLMFATISTIDYSGHPGIGLAKSITSSENGRIWTVKLKDGLVWSDGEPITNEDVIFTTELIKNPAVTSVYNSNLSNVRVSENENGEIIFTLPTAYADFVTALNIPIVPKHILSETDPRNLVENNFSNSPVTSGAFSFNALQRTGITNEQVIYLTANPYYYKGRPFLNSFAVHTYEDKNSLIEAINAGAVTATAELSGADADKIVSSQFYQKDSKINSGAFLFFNTSSTVMKNISMRRAIRQGLDLTKIRAEAPGTTPIDYPFIESQISLTNYPVIPGYNFEAAKSAVTELSNNEEIKIEIATVNSGYLPNVTNAIASALEEIGIKTHVSVYEENQDFITNAISRRNYDILVYEIELGADPDLLPYYHSSQASSSGLNLSNYRNTLADDLLLSARDTTNEASRAKKYETFLEYWVTDVPAIALYQPNLTYYYNKNVRTFSNDVRLVTALDRFSDITSWAVIKATKNKTP